MSWISNYVHNKLCDVISDAYPDFNGVVVKQVWIRNCIPRKTMDVFTFLTRRAEYTHQKLYWTPPPPPPNNRIHYLRDVAMMAPLNGSIFQLWTHEKGFIHVPRPCNGHWYLDGQYFRTKWPEIARVLEASIQDKTSYLQISWNLEASGMDIPMRVTLWNVKRRFASPAVEECQPNRTTLKTYFTRFRDIWGWDVLPLNKLDDSDTEFMNQL